MWPPHAISLSRQHKPWFVHGSHSITSVWTNQVKSSFLLEFDFDSQRTALQLDTTEKIFGSSYEVSTK